MSKITKKAFAIMMAFFMCFSSMHWQVFAESSFTASAWNSEVYTSVNEPCELEVYVYGDYENLTYNWQRKDVSGEWISLEETTNIYEVSAYDYYSSNDVYKCTVSDGTDSQEVFFTVFPDNNLQFSERVGERYFDIGESVAINPQSYACDFSSLTQTWEYTDPFTEQTTVLVDRAAVSEKDDINYVADTFGTYTLTLTDTKYYNYESTVKAVYHVYVSNNLSAIAWDTSFILDDGETIELMAELKAYDLSDGVYYWEKMTNDDWVEIEGTRTQIGSDTENVLRVYHNVSEYGNYRVTVIDKFNNDAHREYTVALQNNFIVRLQDGTLIDEYNNGYEVRVEAGSDVDLILVPEGKVTDGVSYSWAEGDGPYSYIGIDEYTNTLHLENVQSFSNYQVQATDAFDNVVYIYIDVIVENHLTAEAASLQNFIVASGDSVTFEVYATADQGELTYKWVADPYGNSTVLDSTTDTCTVENITSTMGYRCEVTDIYGTTVYVHFSITGVVKDGDTITVGYEETYTLYDADNGNTRLFRFIPEETRYYTIATYVENPRNNVTMYLYNDNNENMTSYQFADGVCFISEELTAGETYYIYVNGNYGISRQLQATVVLSARESHYINYYVKNTMVGTLLIAEDEWNVPYDASTFNNYIALDEGEAFLYWTYAGERFEGPVFGNMDLFAYISFGNTVRYHLYGGTIVEKTIYYEDDWRLAYNENNFGTTYEPSGYIFSHWSLQPEGPEFDGSVTSDTDLYAVFVQAVNVTYHDDDGTLLGTRLIEVPDDPGYLTWWIYITSFDDHDVYKNGLRFTGWTDTLGSQEFFEGSAYEGLNLYAVYKPEYRITYHLNDETAVTILEVEGDGARYPEYVVDDYVAPTDGTQFRYWIDESGNPYYDSFSRDMDLWAVYDRAYQITYHANEQVLEPTVTVFEDEEYQAAGLYWFYNYTPVEGQVFSHWSLTENGEEFTGPVTGNMDLFAVFTEGVAVEYYDEDGETLIGTRYLVDGSEGPSWIYITFFNGQSEYKDGRRFAGWSNEIGSQNYFDGVAYDGLCLYAIYLPVYNVTYQIYDGRTVEQEVLQGYSPNPPQDIFDDYTDPEGQAFAYWAYEDGSKFEGGFYSDTVLIAVYGTAHRITYHLGEEEIGTEITTEENEYGFWYHLNYFGVETPEGFEFTGWSLTDGGEHFDGPVTSDIDLYAILEKTFCISFYLNDTKIGEKNTSRSYAYGVIFDTKISDFGYYEPVAGKKFVGWRDINGKEFYEITSDTNVYAYFEDVLTIRYHLNGEIIYTREDATVSDYIINDILYEQNMIPDGYTVRYKLKEDAKSFVYDSLPAGTTDLYVFITKIAPVINLAHNDGTGDSDRYILNEWNENAVFLSTIDEYKPVREGYLFAGWTYDAAGNQYVEDRDLILDDITLYASWISADKGIVCIRLQGFYEDSIYDVSENNVVYDAGTIATVNIEILDDFSFIRMYEVYQLETGTYDIQEFEGCLSREISFEVQPGMNIVYIGVYRGLNTLTFIVDESDRSKDVVLVTNRYDKIDLNDIPVVEKDGYFHYGWALDIGRVFDFNNEYFYFDRVFTPLLAESGKESTVAVEFRRLYYDADDRPKYEVFTPTDIRINGTGSYLSGEDYSVTIDSDSYYILRSLTMADDNDNQLSTLTDIQVDGFYFRYPVLGRNNYTVSSKALPGVQKLVFYVAQDGTVNVVNNMSDILTVSNNATNGIKAGETVNIHFDIADGYALDQNKPFVMDDIFMNHYYDSVALDGDILDILTVVGKGYDYELNTDVVTVTEDSISWVMGAANFMFTPNIIFVGYDTPTENDLTDILSTDGEDEYSAPGIVFYNESEEAKEYIVTFSKPTTESPDIHSALLATRSVKALGSTVTPIEGEDGIGRYVLYVTKGTVGDEGNAVKEEPVYVENLKSITVVVEAGEFVTYSIQPQEPETVEIKDIKFEVTDTEENVIQSGYITTDDTSKHLVYEEGVLEVINITMLDPHVLKYTSSTNDNYNFEFSNPGIAAATVTSTSTVVSSNGVSYVKEITIKGIRPGKTKMKIYKGSVLVDEYYVKVAEGNIEYTASTDDVHKISYTLDFEEVFTIDNEVVDGKYTMTKNTSTVTIGGVSNSTTTYTYNWDIAIKKPGTYEFNIVGNDTGKIIHVTATITPGKPDAPVQTEPTMNTEGITVNWEASELADKYVVYRKESGGSYTKLATTSKLTYKDTTAVGGVKYTYAIKAYNSTAKLYSDNSNTKTVTYNPFSDVSTSSSQFKYVMWAFNSGMVGGTSKTTFSPSGTCLRRSFALMLWKMNGRPAPQGTSPFTDISGCTANEQKAILWAYGKGIIGGTSSTTFTPNGDITRRSVVLMLWKAAGKPQPKSSTNPFTDISKCSANEQKAILWAYENGITKGTSDSTFSPNNKCTRVQLVTFLYKYNALLKIME